MILRSLTLQNFRSFGPQKTVIDFDKFTTLIGANSTGKTTAMHALRRLFSPNAHDRIIERSDFHVSKSPGRERVETSLLIEAKIEFPELIDDNKPRAGHTVPPLFRHLAISEDDTVPYVCIRLTAELHLDGGPEESIEQYTYFPSAASSDQKGLPLSSQHRSHIQFIYIPALRDPGAQIKYHAGTLRWRLMRAVAWSNGIKSKIESSAKDTQDIFENETGYCTIKEALRKAWSSFHDDDRYQEIDFRVAGADLESILTKADMVFRPSPAGMTHDASALGDGLRSLAYFSLVCALLDVEHQLDLEAEREKIGLLNEAQAPALTIVAAEEPENHLAPHLFGRALKRLNESAELPGAQVVISSHTASILKRVAPESIRYFRINNSHQTEISPIRLPETRLNVFKYVRGAVRAYPEMYFAKLVILVEGESEDIVLSRVLEAHRRPVDLSQISIVPIGGRHVNHFWRLLNDLKIPHVTLLDLDRGREGGGWGRIRYAVKQIYFLNHPEKKDEEAREACIEIKIGSNRKTLTKDDLDAYSRAENFSGEDELQACITKLREHNVFFSSPLDLDFMMLTSFPDQYSHENSFPEGRGPQLPDDPEKLRDKLIQAEKSVLKTNGSSIGYTSDQKKLFVEYDYLFLGRGKPVTHMIALASISDDELRDNLPEPLVSLVARVESKLSPTKETSSMRTSSQGSSIGVRRRS